MLNRFRPLIDTLLLPRNFFARSRTIRRGAVFALAFAAGSANAEPASSIRSLEALLQSQELTVLADVKHGVRERIEFFSSTALFEAMKRAGVRHVAIEMPRVLGRQAMGIESEVDVNAFAQDVIRSGHWHFVDPDHPDEIESATQERVATALGRQVLLAKTLGINPIFYDFNNPLGGFTTFNDPVYRCIAELSGVTWVRYGLDGKISKAERDAAIMRERFSHDDELADYIEQNVRERRRQDRADPRLRARRASWRHHRAPRASSADESDRRRRIPRRGRGQRLSRFSVAAGASLVDRPLAPAALLLLDSD
jgi:hypothetical protein